MVRDGHSGIENRVLKTDHVEGFKLSLNYLTETDGASYFVIHASTNIIMVSPGLSPNKFLEILGFEKSNVHCTEHGEDCYYQYVYEVPTDGHDYRYNEFCHNEYKRLVENFRTIYDTCKNLFNLMGKHAKLFTLTEAFRQPKMLDISGDVPAWVDDFKVQEHKDIEKGIKENTAKDSHFKRVEYCLCGKGEELVDSIQITLESLGLKVTRTKKGSTIDLILEVPDTEMIFGFEITGTNEPIKKNSNKLTQALTFEQRKKGKEKTIILANTFNDKPIKERGSENFTPEAVDFMKRNLITGLTTFDLYKIWKACKYESKDIKEIMKIIFEHPGGVYAFP